MHSSADTSSFAVDLCLFFNLTPFRSLPWNKGAPIVLSSFARLQALPGFCVFHRIEFTLYESSEANAYPLLHVAALCVLLSCLLPFGIYAIYVQSAKVPCIIYSTVLDEARGCGGLTKQYLTKMRHKLFKMLKKPFQGSAGWNLVIWVYIGHLAVCT